MNLDKFNEQSDMTRDGVSLPVKLWYSFLGILIKARDSRRRRNMKEYDILVVEEYHKVVTVKADNGGDAWDKVEKMYEEGEIITDYNNFRKYELYNVTTYKELDEKIGKAFPIVKQGDLDA